MFDVFYTNKKPNLFVFEQPAESLTDAAAKCRTEFFWLIDGSNDYSNFDFSWTCAPWESEHVHVFPTQHQADGGVYFSARDHAHKQQWHYRSEFQAEAIAPDIFFIDMHNASAKERLAKLKTRYPHVQSVRYFDNLLDTLKRCANKATSSKFWAISSENIYDDFDFSWHATSWQDGLTHVFPTQWDKWSDTFLFTKWEFDRHSHWAKSVAEFPNLNFVQDQYVKTGNDNFDMYYVEHGNPDNSLASLQSRYPRVKVTRFVDNLLDVLRRIMNSTTAEHVWVTSSLCDYTAFDFTWTPEPWQAEMIHCFGSEFQKRGDTFYIHVESFKKQMTDLELLDWFNVICYHQDNLLLRFDPEHVFYNSDNLVEEILKHEFSGPYAMFMNRPGGIGFEPCMWTQKDRAVTSATPDNGCVAIPRDIKQYLKTQVYDYPYIDKTHNKAVDCIPMDVIFISYDEKNADANWDLLQEHCPRAKRLHGIAGMENALKAAANLSSTHWFFAVFAKTKVHPGFNFSFQPDLFQQPKHYIFHAENPLNGLVYGHMGIILHNKKLLLDTLDFGFDYSLSSLHEVIPEVSAIAAFNTSAYQTWRTAFREAAKLSQINDETPDVETQYRLNTWLTRATGDFADWCLRGARDGVEFYVANSHEKAFIKNANDWTWLRRYFTDRYGDIE